MANSCSQYVLVSALVVCHLLKSPSLAHSCRTPTLNDCTTPPQLVPQGQTIRDTEVEVNLSSVFFKVSEQFLSVTLDASQLRHNWRTINFTLPRVVNMAKALSPAMLRVGGTSEDFIIFQNTKLPQNHHKHVTAADQRSKPVHQLPNTTNFTMNTQQWDEVNRFVETVGWDLVFGLNLLLRHPWPNGTWDSSNAEELMKYTTSQGYKVNWELGNEPNLFPEKAPNIPVSPEQNAGDHRALKQLADRLSPDTAYIVGPDTTHSGTDYFCRFLQAVGRDVINAATWHDYYINCLTANLPADFYSVTVLDSLIELAQTAQSYVTQYRADAELWFGETSSCIKSYSSTVPSTYVAGFMWLDKLGIAAITNHTRVFRQSIVGSSYALLNNSLFPRSDYWLSLLHKRLVGQKVLYVTGSLKPGRYVRVYSHCALPPYTSGSVVLLILNLHGDKAVVSLTNKQLAQSSRDVYWLTPPGGNITALEVSLNGKILRLVGDQIPQLEPLQEEASSSLSLPPLSFGFYVFKDVLASACTESG